MADKFQLKALITGVDKLSPMLSGVRKNAAQTRKQLESSNLGKIGFSDVLQGGMLAAPFVMGAKAAMGYESQMADVAKVVDFETPEQFQQMSRDVLKLSTQLPMAAEGIAQIIAEGGQSGIARDELMGFAEDAVKMGVAFDLTAEQAGGMMSDWRAAFRMNQQEVTTLADQINHLGNTAGAKASAISGIVTKIGPLGEIAGVASGEIAALGATMLGVGVNEDIAATSIKNFMVTLTAGTAATKAQSDMMKALRLDSAEVAKGMQTDAQGTIRRVLTAIGKVDADKRAGVMSTLFGTQSITAIAPLMTNLEALETNFRRVSDAQQYAGSMEKEYAARAETTENNLKLLTNQVTALGISVGAVLLPPFNDFMATIGPIIGGVADLAAANPWLIKGILGAAVGFTVLRVAVMASTVALKLMSAVAGMSPIGLIVRGIALAAGFLLANWSAVAPFFAAMWDWIKGVFVTGSAQIVGFLSAAIGQIMGGLGVLWGGMMSIFGFTPLGMIINNWEPIVAWMKGLWERVSPYLEPILSAAKWAFGDSAPASSSPASGSGTTSLAAQTAAANRTNLQGDMVVRFENAPAGLRVDPAQTNQPGLSVTPQVGYRSLGAAGA